MDTPSQEIIKAGNLTAVVVDDNNRSITIKRVGPLDRMRLFEIIGADNVKNEAYFGYAILAYHVIEIDGVPTPKPTTKLSLEGLVQRLDDAGLVAIAKGVTEKLGVQKTEDADQADAIKNG
jgi:hypothetical protein